MRAPSARILLFAALVSLLLAPVGWAPAQNVDVMKAVGRTAPARSGPAWREGQVIVALRSGLGDRDAERVFRAGGGVAARRARSGPTYLVTLEPGESVPEAVQLFRGMAEVDYAEPNGLVHESQAETFSPNDPYFKYQWNLKQVGAERTWAIQQGKPTVGIAVLDTGAAYEDYADPVSGRVYHKAPDWGDTVFLPGYDFVNMDSHPNDDEYHGTHVASTIAEGTNNALGMAGLAFGCAIMPVKVLDETGAGSYFDVAQGIDYATSYTEGGEHPVKVINMSFGGSAAAGETVRQAVDRAYAAGIVIVAAAGNSGREGIDFPAALPHVIAAGALDERKERASYSSTGPELDLMAPGGNCNRDDDKDGVPDCVFQQMPNPDYVAEGLYDHFCICGLDGTSMASPHVAAAAALVISQGITDPDSVRAALEQTAERLGGAPEGGRNDTYGSGLIQPASALSGLGFNQGPVR
jgi:serine protease